MFQRGDRVIFTKQKYSACPGPRAQKIDPAPMGELYFYMVDKFWTVSEVREEENSVVLETRRHKKHVISMNDPQLRHPNLWERFIHRNRFPELKKTPTSSNES